MSKIIYYSSSNYSEFKIGEEQKELLGKKTFIEKGGMSTINLLLQQEEVQLDIETIMTELITERKITVVQIGLKDNSSQVIFDIPRLSGEELGWLMLVLKRKMTFFAHNAMFEYTAIKAYFGIDLFKLRDTFLQSKLLANGLYTLPGWHSLSGIVYREYGVALDKGSQTTFDGEILNQEQFFYAVYDVIFLSRIHSVFEKDLKENKNTRVYYLECSAVRPVGDMHVNGILFDMKYHTEHTVKTFTAIYNSTKKDMQSMIDADIKLKTYLTLEKYIQEKDEYLFKWSSPKIKKQLLRLVIPGITSSNKILLKKMLKEDTLDIKQTIFLTKFLEGDTDWLETYLINKYHDDLVTLDLFIAKDTFMLNFDSPTQRLYLFKFWYPQLQDTNAKTLTRLVKGILPVYKKYIKAAKMLSSFGEKMEDYIEKDKRIHPSFNQLVSTGRMSSSKPNGQNQPSTSEYRNAYYAQDGWSFVGADYSSQEILVAAQASGDDGFWYAIKNGYDLHSYSASQIYGKEHWLETGGHWPPVGKPKTKEANGLRKASKSLSFSLFYGSSAKSLAENLNIPHSEAQILMDKYYKTFPKLAAYFKRQNQLGKKYKYSRGLPPFNRIRFYDTPRHKGDIEAIGRQSQNAGIQGTSADMTKLALVYIKKYIEQHDLGNKVKITLQVHDEIICEVHDSIVKSWAKMQSKLMEMAADVIIPGGWLKAEAEIMKRWNK